MLKVVVDANVWVSALKNPGNARKIRDDLAFGRFRTFYSSSIFNEIAGVLARPKMASYFEQSDAQKLLVLLQRRGKLIESTEVPQSVSRDPKDNKYLLCAKTANCDYLVSGDDDLLSLGEYSSVKIISPAQFVEIMETGR